MVLAARCWRPQRMNSVNTPATDSAGTVGAGVGFASSSGGEAISRWKASRISRGAFQWPVLLLLRGGAAPSGFFPRGRRVPLRLTYQPCSASHHHGLGVLA